MDGLEALPSRGTGQGYRVGRPAQETLCRMYWHKIVFSQVWEGMFRTGTLDLEINGISQGCP